MTCKELTSRIDLHEIPVGLIPRIRFRMHLLVCRACRNYLQISRVLTAAIRGAKTGNPESASEKKIDVEKMTADLVKKHGR